MGWMSSPRYLCREEKIVSGMCVGQRGMERACEYISYDEADIRI